MGFAIDWAGQIVQITTPTVSVDGQTLHDFIEDQMATPVGKLNDDIIQPEGKIEDASNPGIFSQIIIVLNSPWQVQFWAGSGYTRIFGAKIVGGLVNQVIKATGAAGDVTVLESPVDGVTAVVETGVSGLTAPESTVLLGMGDRVLGYSRIDYDGADLNGWQRVQYNALGGEVGRYNLMDEVGVRISGTAQAFADAKKMVGHEIPA